MSDPIHDALRQLRDQRPPGAFAEPEAVRRRGRRRTQRLVAAAGVAVLALGTGAMLAVNAAVGGSVAPDGPPAQPGGGASGAPSTVAAPLPSVSAAVLVLRPADLGPGDWRPAGSELLDGAQPWYWADLCGDAASAALAHRVWVDVVSYRNGPPGRFEDAQPRYSVIVERYRSGRAGQSLREVRDAVNRCDDGFDVAGSGFAGQESLLVRYRIPGDGDQFIPVVRGGDVVATIFPPAGKDPEVARALARTVAARLR